MIKISVSEKLKDQNNLLYITTTLSELLSKAECEFKTVEEEERCMLNVNCPERYAEIVRAEISDKLAEIVAVNYKYKYFSEKIRITGLNDTEREILMASLIAADLTEDKRYAYERFKSFNESAIDGVYNFRLSALKKKWTDIVEYMPSVFVNNQLKDFMKYLLENKKKRVYVDNGKVYDSHYKRLIRCELLPDAPAKITREIIMANSGEVELSGKLNEEDEYYLKEYFGDKIYFSTGYYG